MLIRDSASGFSCKKYESSHPGHRAARGIARFPGRLYFGTNRSPRIVDSSDDQMPELPDITIYQEALRSRLVNRRLERVRIVSPSILKTADPPITDAAGRMVREIARLGKQIIISLDDDVHLVIHLMIAGRFHWKQPGAAPNRKITHALFDFPDGTLALTEASSKKRASLSFVRGKDSLRAFDRGGLEVLSAAFDDFASALHRENHTVKRALTDPRLFSGIGNAYSDEILHCARISPLKWTNRLADAEQHALFTAARSVMTGWIDRLRKESADAFPENVTAFREEMAAYGKFGKPCPVCGTPIRRIVYADNECNYCPRCQTGGMLLADRSLSRLLRGDWPRSIDET